MTILDLISRTGLVPKRAAATNGGEYASACPRCGGTDRFRSWPEKGRWMCRGCNLSGDMVEFLREYQGLSCPDAHEYLAIPCISTTCSVINTCRVGKAAPGTGQKRPLESVQPKQEKTKRAWQAGEADSPDDVWQQKAQKLVERAHARLLENKEQLQYLAERGLPIEAVRQYQLGWVPEDFWRTRESWGLPTELKKNRNGKRVAKKLWIPQGIVIPFFAGEGVDKNIQRIRIRRPEGEPRYYWLPGSGNDTFLIGADRQAFVAVESDLDGLMIHHHAGDLVGVVCVGNTTAKPKRQAAEVLSRALHILVSLDVGDEPDAKGQRPGAIAAKWWQETFVEAERWPVPVGGDPGEAYQAGVDIRQWILEGLPPVFYVQAKPTPATLKPEPIAPMEKPEPQIRKGVSKNGFAYLIAQDKETRRTLEKENKETAVFIPAELDRLRGLDLEVAELHIHIKTFMSGAEIIGRRELRK